MPGLDIQIPPGSAFKIETPPMMPKMHLLAAVVAPRGYGKGVITTNLIEQLKVVDRLILVSPSAETAVHGNPVQVSSQSPRTTLEDRLVAVGTWAGLAGEAVVTHPDAHIPEAVVTRLLLCDGEPGRRNRRFILHPDVRASECHDPTLGHSNARSNPRPSSRVCFLMLL